VIKIWFLLMLISMPNQPSIKYQGAIYSTEEQCMMARQGFHNGYENKSDDYKRGVVVDSFCLPFEAFPIKGMNYNNSSMGT